MECPFKSKKSPSYTAVNEVSPLVSSVSNRLQLSPREAQIILCKNSPVSMDIMHQCLTVPVVYIWYVPVCECSPCSLSAAVLPWIRHSSWTGFSAIVRKQNRADVMNRPHWIMGALIETWRHIQKTEEDRYFSNFWGGDDAFQWTVHMVMHFPLFLKGQDSAVISCSIIHEAAVLDSVVCMNEQCVLTRLDMAQEQEWI